MAIASVFKDLIDSKQLRLIGCGWHYVKAVRRNTVELRAWAEDKLPSGLRWFDQCRAMPQLSSEMIRPWWRNFKKTMNFEILSIEMASIRIRGRALFQKFIIYFEVS